MEKQLSEFESKIYDLICSGIQPSDIAKRQEYRQRKSTMKSVIGRLTKMGFLEKTKINRKIVRYTPLIEQYDKISKRRKREKPIKISTIRLELEPFSNVEVTKAMSQEIYFLSKSGVSRGAIAERLSLPRYLINRERIAKGLDKA